MTIYHPTWSLRILTKMKCLSTGGDYNPWTFSNGFVNSPAWHVPYRVNQVRNVMVHATPRTLTNRFLPVYPRWSEGNLWEPHTEFQNKNKNQKTKKNKRNLTLKTKKEKKLITFKTSKYWTILYTILLNQDLLTDLGKQ